MVCRPCRSCLRILLLQHLPSKHAVLHPRIAPAMAVMDSDGWKHAHGARLAACTGGWPAAQCTECPLYLDTYSAAALQVTWQRQWSFDCTDIPSKAQRGRGAHVWPSSVASGCSGARTSHTLMLLSTDAVASTQSLYLHQSALCAQHSALSVLSAPSARSSNPCAALGAKHGCQLRCAC